MATKPAKKSNTKLRLKKEKVKDLSVKGSNKVVGGIARGGEPCGKQGSELLSPFTT
jgi:hypothetical protein